MIEKNKIRFAHCNIISKNWRKLSEFYIAVFDCTIQPPARNQSGIWLSKGTGVPNASLGRSSSFITRSWKPRPDSGDLFLQRK